MQDIGKGLETGYDRGTLKIKLPNDFAHTVLKDAQMQISSSFNLVPVVLQHKRNVVSEGVGIVFIVPTLYGPKDRNLEPLKYDNAITRGEQFADLFKNDLKLETSVIEDPSVQDVKQKYEKLNEISLKFKEKHFISDQTKVGGKAWHELRASAMKEDYTE